jgi:hypothetical protein
MKCEECGKEVVFPFTCSYCGKSYCDEHRLPENHQCSNQPTEQPPYVSPPYVSPKNSKGKMSRFEPHSERRSPTNFKDNWVRRHQRAPYLLIGLALFFPLWAVGLWKLVLAYGTSSVVPLYFGLFTLICLSWVLFPCGLGHGAFRRRYRTVVVADTNPLWGGGERTTYRRGTQVRESEWWIAIACAIFFLFFIPFVVGDFTGSELFYIMSALFPIGSVLLGIGSFNVLTKASNRLRRSIHLRLPE